jgi:hypothetical protein
MGENIPAPTLLPEPHRRHVDEVVAIVERMRSFREQESAQYRVQYSERAAIRHSVASITGGRGAGKTTVLEEVSVRLRTMTDLVLPVVRPEFFSSSDSVLGLVLANLHRVLERADPGILQRLGNDGETSVSTLINRLLRKASVVGTRDAAEGRHQPQSLEAAADDFVRSASVAAGFVDQWHELVRMVRHGLAETGNDRHRRMIIVPVDDADLAPELLPRILVDLRIIGSAPGVVCLVCIDLEEARRSLGEHYLSAYPNLRASPSQDLDPQRRLSGIVESQLSKAIPPENRTTIHDLMLRERLAFSPLGSPDDLDLKSLLSHHVLPPGGTAAATLADLFIFPGTEEATPYAECLSSNPRELETLHSQLTAAQAGSSSSDASSEAVRAVLTHGLHFGLRNSPPGPVTSPEDLLTFDSSSGKTTARVVMTDVLAFGRDMGVGRVTLPTGDLEPGSAVSIGAISETVATWGKPNEKVDYSKRVHRAVTQSLLLVHELSHAYSLLEEDFFGQRPIKGGQQPCGAIRVTLGRDRTDQRFLLLPAWEAYYDYHLVERGWNSVLKTVEQHHWRQHRTPLAAVTLEWWHLLTHVQASRTVPNDAGEIVRRVAASAAPEDVTAEAFAAVWQELESTYRAEVDRIHIRSQDFIDWFECYLLFVCHPALHSDSFIRQTIQARNELVERSNRAQIANSGFIARITGRLRRLIGEAWITPLIDLTAQFDEAAGAEIARLQTAAQEQKRSNVERRIGSLIDVRPASADAETLFNAAMRALQDLEAEVQG